MKKILLLISMFLLTFNGIFASNNANVLINGHLGEDLPPAIVLEVNSTIVEENGGAVAIMDNYNFTTNRTSQTMPVYVYIGYSSYMNSSNILFNLTVSTDGFKSKDTSGVLVGSPLDVDIQLHTETLYSPTSKILVGSSVLDFYNSNIFQDLSSTPASYVYSVEPGASINDSNFLIWFLWSEKENAPAGQYGALINFSITAS
jgi:hypothetical protein